MDRKENFSRLKHLYNRAGFGAGYADLLPLSKKSINTVVDSLLEMPRVLPVLTNLTFDGFKQERLLLSGLKKTQMLSPEQKMERVRLTRARFENGRRLNVDWMLQLQDTAYPLLEKMTLFWHGHFACRSDIPYFSMQLNNVQRANAFGSFKTLLVEVAKTPAMLQYLNNQQNRKGHPNENFARELMELFTLGRGNYTEDDIKESARSFTGWKYDEDGNFLFNTRQHDVGNKTFFGLTGPFDGEAIIDMILKKPATATFICRKLYLFFVNDVADETHVKELADYFYAHDYHIGKVLKKLFTAEWFYAKENVGNKIKSPVEFLTGLGRAFNVKYEHPEVLIRLQSSLGQYLFNPPNVAGWPGGRSWIDSSSLMLRLRLPSLILNNGVIDFEGKADPEDEALIALNGKKKNINTAVKASADWPRFLDSLPRGMKPAELAAFILAPAMDNMVNASLSSNISLKNTVVVVTSMPEYQLC